MIPSPGHGRAFTWRVTSGRRHDTNKALELIDDALEQQADYPPLSWNGVRMLLAFGKTAQAIEALKQAAAALNPLPEYRVDAERGFACGGSHRRGAGRGSRIEAPRRDRTIPEPSLFTLQHEAKMLRTALRLATTELETRADVFTLDALAWAWMANGNIEQASGFRTTSR